MKHRARIRVLSALLAAGLALGGMPLASAAAIPLGDASQTGVAGINYPPTAFDDPLMGTSATLLAEDAAEWDTYGEAVAIDGDTAVVGAHYADEAGAAYVLQRINGEWRQVAKLASSDPAANEFFGGSVDIENGTIVVGEHLDAGGGAVHVFTGSGSSWTHRAKIEPTDTAPNDAFGYSVALSGDTIAIGAYNGAATAGAAYTFVGGGDTWAEQEKFTGGAATDEFGWSVAIDGDTVLVGAHQADSPAFNAGAAYVYTRVGTDWSFQQKLVASDQADSDYFGWSVALAGDTALVAAKYDDDLGNVSGSVYSFERSGTTWVQGSKITPDDGTAQDEFGYAVAFDGNTAIVGAQGTDAQGEKTGSAYLFHYAGGAWIQDSRLDAEDAAAGAYFGAAVAIDEGSAIVGAYHAAQVAEAAGAAYVYDSYYMIDEDTSLTVEAPGVLANDFDLNGDALQVQGTQQAAHGYVMQTTTGYFEYTPEPDYNGFDSFTYECYDGQDYSQPATVHIYVRPAHDYVSIAGDTRFETGAQAALAAFPEGATAVVLATGRNFPDALGGSALAGALDAPLLLVDTASVPGDVLDTIEDLGATRAIILGGTSAVSDAVKPALLSAMGPGSTIERIAGDDRYETAREVAAAAIDELGGAFGGTAFVATGSNFPDALAAGPVAASAGWPIYLVANAAADATTLQAMDADGVTDVYAVGGIAVVTPATFTSLESRFGAASVDRVAGDNRYETAVEVSTLGIDAAAMRWDGVGLAKGTDFPDALAAGAMLGSRDSVLLLSASDALSDESETALSSNRGLISDVYYFGGTSALSQAVRTRVQQVIEAP